MRIYSPDYYASTVSQALIDKLDFTPPQEYLAYLLNAESNYEFIGAYLIEIDELLQFNADHQADAFYRGYFLIGSNGSGEAFAIEKATGNFVFTPFIGHDEETPIVVGRTWSEFLEYLQTEYLWTDCTCAPADPAGAFSCLRTQQMSNDKHLKRASQAATKFRRAKCYISYEF